MGASKPDNPLGGKAPAPDEFRDEGPEGREPNDMVHQPLKEDWKKRPGQYPAAQEGIQNTDVPTKRK